MQYSFKKLNLIVGWLSFVLASTVYLLTMEPTASFWDCSEFIATSYKLEVGHPPGAPLFMMISRFFTMFGGPGQAAVLVNSMSALASGRRSCSCSGRSRIWPGARCAKAATS